MTLLTPSNLTRCTTWRRSHTRVDEPVHTGDTTGMGSMHRWKPFGSRGVHCRFYQASSSELPGTCRHRRTS